MRVFKIMLVAITLFLEFYFLTVVRNPYPHGMIHDVSYRRAERFTTLRDYLQHPSADTKAVFDREVALMHKHEDWKEHVALGLLLAANVTAVYFLLQHEKKTSAA
jgi:hypothetical protein